MADFHAIYRPHGALGTGLRRLTGWPTAPVPPGKVTLPLGSGEVELTLWPDQGPVRPGDLFVEPDLAGVWVGSGRLRGVRAAVEGPGVLSQALCQAWRRLGVGALQATEGPLALVIVERHGGGLVAARDKIGRVLLGTGAQGERDNGPAPFHIGTCWERLVEGALGKVGPEQVCGRRLAAMMAESDDDQGDDFWQGLGRLRPGEALRVGPDGSLRRWYFWNPPRARPQSAGRADHTTAMAEALRGTLLEILAAYGPGAHRVVSMSGGLDSTAVAALELGRAGGAQDHGHPLEVATMVAPGLAGLDERPYVLEMARALPGIRPHAFAIEGHWPLREPQFYGAQWATGPQFHPEEIWVAPFHGWLAQHFPGASMLYGHGADDALWGTDPGAALPGHLLGRALRAGRRVPRGLRRVACAQSSPADPLWQNARNWLATAPPDHGARSAERLPDETDLDPRVARLRGWRWELVMRTLDREGRRSRLAHLHPMLDSAFWQICLALPCHGPAPGQAPAKALLREACRGQLPKAALLRPKHSSFDALVEKALAHREAPRVRAMLENPALGRMGLVQPAPLTRAYEAYLAHVPQRPGPRFRGSMTLWQTLAAELWLFAIARARAP